MSRCCGSGRCNCLIYSTDDSLIITEVSGGYNLAVPGGGSDKHYSQSFTSLALVNVNHNLGKRPAVSVIDSSNDEVVGDVTYVDNNNLTVSFSAAFSGTILCN